MFRRFWLPMCVVCLTAAVFVVPLLATADDNENSDDQAGATESKAEEAWAPAVKSKPLSDEVKKGLKWLVDRQLDSGGWGQGDESSAMRGSSHIYIEGAINSSPNIRMQQMAIPSSRIRSSSPDPAIDLRSSITPLPRSSAPVLEVQSSTPAPVQSEDQVAQVNQTETVQQKPSEIPSVADTCMATLALIRSGSTPSKGEYAESIARAVRFLCCQVEESDEDSILVTKTRGTRVQSKLGPYIDTFMTAMVLPEVVEKMPTKKDNKRVEKALVKVLAKMKKNQREDGTWSDQGWAATLAQGAAVKGMNRAAQISSSIAKTVEPMRARTEQQAQSQFDSASGTFASKGSAGVQLYSAGANLSALSDNYNTNRQQAEAVEREAKEAKTEEARKAAKQKLERFKSVERDLTAAQEAVVKKLDDQRFIAGFGNNGGEEFLSYMNIGEGLVVKGGDNWKTWDKSITENLNRVQNQDGSWSGHHCITGRTFCTSAALLVLMVDRAPMPVAAKVKGR